MVLLSSSDYLNPEKLLEHTDLSQIVFVNSNLPMALRTKWRFLFSSKMHGESFSTMLGSILGQGATVIFIEDTNGYVFGSYSTDSWVLGPKFAGNCFQIAVTKHICKVKTSLICR